MQVVVTLAGQCPANEIPEEEMKSRLASVLAVMAVCGGSALAESNAVPAAAPSPDFNDAQKQAYVVGVMNAMQVKEGAGLDNLDMDVYLQGFRDGYNLTEDKWRLNQKQMQEVVTGIRQTASKKHEERQRRLQEENKTKGDAYLKSNAEKPGVKTTASGLQYEVLKEGSGPNPKDGESVKVSYKGTLINGDIFDQNESATFGVGQVIPGWTEALKMMSVGAKYRLVIPSKLAYGERGTGNGRIPPNATLVFEVELLGIQPAGAAGSSARPPAPPRTR